jgi:hypothetical protein
MRLLRFKNLDVSGTQEGRYLCSRKVGIASLDDKLKLVGHCRMFDKLQLVDEVVKRLLW